MKWVVIVLVLLVLGIVGLGFYQGWWGFATDNTGDKINITFTVDPERIRADKDKVFGTEGKANSDEGTGEKERRP
jgi:hypothetical protein